MTISQKIHFDIISYISIALNLFLIIRYLWELSLIKRDTEEVITNEELKNLLEIKSKPTSYWGVAPTGPPHIGYYRAIAKQKDLVDAGFNHKILIADIHAYLDDRKSPWEELEKRSKIYEECFKLLGLNEGVEYIRGSSIQETKDYQNEVLKASALVTVNRAIRAASETCRMENPKVSSLIYPIMQSLDCWALDVDAAYGGTDQRHVYALSRELLPQLNHNAPTVILTPLGKSTTGKEKMSASKRESRLELFAQPEVIRKKIYEAFCPPKILEENPILEYNKYFIFPRIQELKMEREQKFGGDVTFKDYQSLEKAFLEGNVHPLDLKRTTAEHIIKILKPIREYFSNSNLLETYKE